MEIKITTNPILKVLQILSWIIFIGLCIEAGGIIVSTFLTLFINPLAVENSWGGSAYLSSLYRVSPEHYVVISITMIIVSVMKAIMFYLIVKLFVDNKLNFSQPFSMELKRFISNLSYLALGIGLFCQSGFKYSVWLTTKGFKTADLQSLHLEGGDVWLFMSVILFVIAQIIKKGIEIQKENDLTI